MSRRPFHLLLCLGLMALLAAGSALAAPDATGPYLEDLTSPELQARLDAGTRTVLIPIGGTEQSGPQMALGKHNVRVRILAGRIAQRLGNAVVAPVLAYVPEGPIHPPAGHMRFAGTISIPEPAFEALLEGTARSLKQHGFRDVFFLGDHGGYRRSLEQVAERLNREWARDPSCRAHALSEYYRVTQTAYVNELKKRGFAAAEIGEHAGLADTSLMLATDPTLVRQATLGSPEARDSAHGVSGDPRRSSVELGQLGVEQIVETSVAAIKAAVSRP
ncbi:MAG: creatininase family protein [Curvibacter sp.]|nr:creatininase family protein [Curvibacter sp.]